MKYNLDEYKIRNYNNIYVCHSFDQTKLIGIFKNYLTGNIL